MRVFEFMIFQDKQLVFYFDPLNQNLDIVLLQKQHRFQNICSIVQTLCNTVKQLSLNPLTNVRNFKTKELQFNLIETTNNLKIILITSLVQQNVTDPSQNALKKLFDCYITYVKKNYMYQCGTVIRINKFIEKKKIDQTILCIKTNIISKSIIIKMRHNCTLSFDQSIRTATILCNIPFAVEGDCIQITQGSKIIYLTCGIKSQLDNVHCKINPRIAALYNLSNNLCCISKKNVPIASKISFEVNNDALQVIQQQHLALQTNMLDQIKYVWKDAVLPYFHKEQELILKFKCFDVCKLDVNSQLQVILIEQKNIKNLEKINQIENMHIKLLRCFEKQIQFTYVNTILINSSQIKQTSFIVTINEIPFGQCPTIDKMLAIAKNQFKHTSQLHIVKPFSEIKKSNYFFSLSKFSSLSESILFTKISNYQIIKLSQFMTSQIQIELICYNCQHFQLKRQFIDLFFLELTNEKQFYFLTGKNQFIINTKLCILTLKSKKNLNNIKFICDIELTEDLSRNFEHKIVIVEGSINLHQYYNSMRNNILQQKKKPIKLFQQVYQAELKQIINYHTSQKCDSLLVSSYNSNGKTLLHSVLQSLQFSMWYIDFGTLSKYTFTEILDYFNFCITFTPYDCLFFDNADMFFARFQQADQMRQSQRIINKVIIHKLLKLLKLFNKKCIITAKSQQNLDEDIIIDKCIQLKNPSSKIKQHILKIQASHKLISQSISFSKLISELQNPSQQKQIKEALSRGYAKLAGVQEAKSAIRDIIKKPIKYAQLYAQVTIKQPKGVLLYGATGNGKSALGKAAQEQFQMKYFSVKGSDILSKYIGGSEAAVRQLFEKAMAVAPSIIFLDQFESIVPRRNANNTGVNDRIVNQFLCYLDGVASLEGVFIIVASSRPDLIDPAVLRPGRLDCHLFLDYPNEEERKQMLNKYRHSINLLDILPEQFVRLTSNFSYSDIQGLFKELRIKKSSLILKELSKQHYAEQFINIQYKLFKETIAKFKLSVNPQIQKEQRRMYQSFRDGKQIELKQKHVLY